MLYWLAKELTAEYSGFNVFSYLTLRAILATMSALAISLLVGPGMIARLSRYQVGQVVRKDGPQTHLVKAGSRLESLETPRGLHWELQCANEAGDGLLASPLERGSHGWRVQQQRFDVPDGCPAQWLRLGLAARIASENQAVGAAWWDDVAILDATPSPE